LLMLVLGCICGGLAGWLAHRLEAGFSITLGLAGMVTSILVLKLFPHDEKQRRGTSA
jgi:uncharacterized membrane protein YeaQ/YmgE (transglycosylase-associated protein family)